MSSRASEAQVRAWVSALDMDANELLTEASVYLQRAPKDKALAERTGDIERGIAAELEASLADRADAARYRALRDGGLPIFVHEGHPPANVVFSSGLTLGRTHTGKDLDAAVDAAIAQGGGSSE